MNIPVTDEVDQILLEKGVVPVFVLNARCIIVAKLELMNAMEERAFKNGGRKYNIYN